MQSCIVVVEADSLDKGDVTYAAKPSTPLSAVPVGLKSKQIVRNMGDTTSLAFTLFDSTTSFPVGTSGLALFFTVCYGDNVVMQIKGKAPANIQNIVYFNLQELPVGFYSYDLSVKAANYSQQLLSGSYVVKN